MTDKTPADVIEQAAMDGLGIYATEGHRITMALMPVVRDALADAWDDGWHAGYRANSYDDGINPWREDRP